MIGPIERVILLEAIRRTQIATRNSGGADHIPPEVPDKDERRQEKNAQADRLQFQVQQELTARGILIKRVHG